MTGKLLNPEQIKCQAVCLVRLNERTEWENRPEKDRSQTNGGLVGTISNEASCRFRLGSLLFNEIRAASYEISKNNTINSFGNGSFYICKLVTNVWKKFRPFFFSHALSSSCEHSFSHFSDPFFFFQTNYRKLKIFHHSQINRAAIFFYKTKRTVDHEVLIQWFAIKRSN